MATPNRIPDNSDDVIDIRDVILRFEELQAQNHYSDNEHAEIESLEMLLGKLRGQGGDHEWQGDWYPVTLIRDSYFEDYAQELAEELDLVKADTAWPYTCIDWEQAAKELQGNYGSVKFDGITYWYRS